MRTREAIALATLGCLMIPACTRAPADATPADVGRAASATGPAHDTRNDDPAHTSSATSATTPAAASTPPATSTTTTTTTTLVVTTTTSTTLPPVTALDTTLVVGDDERLPITAAIPVTHDRPEVDDLVASWLAVTRVQFESEALAVVQAREAARLAAEAEAARIAAETAARAAEAAAAGSSLPPPPTTTTTVPPPPPPPPPELSIAHEEPVVRPAHTTLRMATTRRLDGPVSVSTTAFHALHDGRVVPSLAWFDATRLPEVADRVRTELGDDAAPGLETVPPSALLADVEGDGSGGIEIRLSSDHTTSGDQRRIVIGAESAAELLTPLGRALAADETPPRADGAVDCTIEACVALTFDDGPGAHTERLLDVLDHAGAVATFLVLGRQVERRPDVARRITAGGHEIGNHSWAHDDLRRHDPDELADDIARADGAIRAATGEDPRFVRPPFGSYDLTVRQLERGFLLWDVDPRDWQHRDPARTVDATMQQVGPGSIVVLHDVHAETVDATPVLIARLRAAGYRLVTASQLIPTVEPGTVYLSQTDRIERPPTTTTTTTTTTVPSPEAVTPTTASSVP